MLLYSRQALLTATLMTAGDDQEVCWLVKANRAGRRRCWHGAAIAGAVLRHLCLHDLVQQPSHVLEHCVRLQSSIHLPHAAREHGQHSAALAMEDLQSLLEGVLVVAVPTHQARLDVFRRWQVLEVEDVPRRRVNAPVSGAQDQRLVWGSKQDDTLDFDLLQECLCLVCSSWKAVEQAAAFLHVCLAQAILHKAQDHLVGDEAALVHELFGAKAKLGPTLRKVAEHITCGKVDEVVLDSKALALRTLS
mmetsp:Transcript_4921/g.9272  ORF Transcript_4921/g.9272 Transcript_4921/m.9272 type:complete len:248 (-) Transcript_4921:246-989(-)